MKKIRTWLTIMLLGITLGASAQYPDDDRDAQGQVTTRPQTASSLEPTEKALEPTEKKLKPTEKALEPTKKLSRKERKALQQTLDSVAYANALQALHDTCFVLEAERVVFKNGLRVYVTPTTNFVSVDEGRAMVQVAFNVPSPGLNGIGGVTVEGPITEYKEKTDKKGTTMLTANVQGVSLSARLYITMCKGTNNATIEILPTFNTRRITLEGRIIPPEESFVIKGRTLPYSMP